MDEKNLEKLKEKTNKFFEWLQTEEGQADIKEHFEEINRQNEILKNQLERFHTLHRNRLDEIINRVKAKYASDEYVKRWYSRSIEPPEDLFWFLYEYAATYGRECSEEEYEAYGNDFVSDMYFINDYYFLKMDGQGSVVHIEKMVPGKVQKKMSILDSKIESLQKLTSNFLFIEYYPHTHCDMYKILNEYTKYKEEKIVLHPVSEGFEKSLDEAVKYISKEKENYFGKES